MVADSKQFYNFVALMQNEGFCRLIREVCQEKVPHGNDIRFTTNSLKAIQEASENFVVETFHKSDLARMHAGRETLSVKDIRFSRFMKPESMWVMTDRLHEKNFFGTVPLTSTKPAKLKLMQEEAAFGKDVNAMEKKLKKKAAVAAAASSSSSRKEKNAVAKAEDEGDGTSSKKRRNHAEDDEDVQETSPEETHKKIVKKSKKMSKKVEVEKEAEQEEAEQEEAAEEEQNQSQEEE